MGVCGLLLAVVGVAGAGLAGAQPPRRLIIDTDMSGDCDDVGATCIAHALTDRGEVNLLAVVHNTGLDTGVGAVSAINAYYGRRDLPVGAYKGSFDASLRGPYVDDLVARFPGPITHASQAPDAVKVYRAALARSPNSSVWISSIGFTTNLEALLRSEPDATSPMTGAELVAAKVNTLAWMGGRYPASTPGEPGLPSPEHNFGFNGIGSSTAFTLAHWPRSVPIVFLGWEVGAPIGTGGCMTSHTAVTNPCRAAYIDHSGAGNDRSSWDPATTLFAVRGPENFYELHSTGHNAVNATTGNNVWVETGIASNQSYLVLKAETAAVETAINELLLLRPTRIHVA
mmetsp:Transcript_17388/g.45403  ORF Transcript_17388/g.45403 Transcript_17388/m.45403 type:complete len:342 (-) Transcript_17388:170-1195(-)